MISQDQGRIDLLGPPLIYSMLTNRGVEPMSRGLLKFLEKIRVLIIFSIALIPKIQR